MADKKQQSKVTTLESNGSGKVQISESVVETIAGIAAREVDGVRDLGKGGIVKAFGGSSPSRGVHVEVGKSEVAIDLDLVVVYGHSIQQVCDGVQKKVTDRVKHMTGLLVKEMNINVVDIYFPEEEKEKPEPRVK